MQAPHGSTRHHPLNCRRFWLRGPTTYRSSCSQHAVALLPLTACMPNVGRTRSAQLVRPTGKLVSTTPHTVQSPAQNPVQWSSHPHTPPIHTIPHTRAHTSTTHHHHHHHHYHHTTRPQHTPPERTATGDASADEAHNKSLGGDEVPFHHEVATLCRKHTAAWSRPRVPAMRSARVPFRVGKLRLVRSNRHPPREFGKHTKEVSQKQRRRAPPHNIDTRHR